MWTYKISTGEISENGRIWGKGYSGFGEAANDPARVREKGVGPLPPGSYRIGIGYSHEKLGLVTMNLDPLPGTEVFGRSAFRIHGDNSTPAPFDGSHGCIVLSRALRDRINTSRDRVLEVVA